MLAHSCCFDIGCDVSGDCLHDFEEGRRDGNVANCIVSVLINWLFDYLVVIICCKIECNWVARKVVQRTTSAPTYIVLSLRDYL